MVEYDAIVIGAGPAGSSTAKEIEKKGFKVLLIDIKKILENLSNAQKQ